MPERYQARRQRLLELRGSVAKYIERTNALLFVEPIAPAHVAQIVAYAYQMRRGRGIMYFPTRQEARSVSNILRQTGLNIGTDTTGIDLAKAASAVVIVRISGMCVSERHARLHYILHATPPRSLESYFADLTVARKTTPPPTSTILYPQDGGSGASDVDAYCRLETCRYAYLVRKSQPTLIEPAPHLFTCNCCDVCISHPLGVAEEQHGQLVSV